MIDDKLGKRYKWAHCPKCGYNDRWITDPIKAAESPHIFMTCECEESFPPDHTPADNLHTAIMDEPLSSYEKSARLERVVIALIGSGAYMEVIKNGVNIKSPAELIVNTARTFCEQMDKP